MGCDIHLFAEKRDGGRWVNVEHPEAINELDARSYSVFGFLAGVRNYSDTPPIAEPRGFPEDASDEVRKEFESWGVDAHTPSWLTLDELLAFDYTAEVEDRRYIRQEGPNFFNGGATCEPGQGKRTTWRKFLGQWFEPAIAKLKEAGAERIVFWFDN